MRVLMLFLDGVGIGKDDPSVNPLIAAHLPAFAELCDGHMPTLHHRHRATRNSTAIPLDANLGVPGLPQSGTGQTALFTGVNGAKVIGKHFGPHPYSTLRPIIEKHNIFRQLIDKQKRPWFANAYPQKFFDYIAQRRSRMTVTTLSCEYAGLPLLRAEDLLAGRGISADITNAGWHLLGYPTMSTITPNEAGRRLARLSSRYDFVLYEYWKTDHAGHAQDMPEAIHALEMFDQMLGGILEELDTHNTLLLLTSDHGNIEDLSIKTHTRNPVPVILYGRRHEAVARALDGSSSHTGNLSEVTPTLMELIVNDG